MTTKIDILKEVILKKNKNQTLMVLESIENSLDDELVGLITQPSVISELHSMLVEHLGVNPHAMKLGKRITIRKQRAILFVRAMKNGVNKAA